MNSKYPRASCIRCGFSTTVRHLHVHHCFGTYIYESEFTESVWKWWRVKMKRRRPPIPPFIITGPQAISMFEEAGIHPNQIGQQPDDYQLGRYGDKGIYEYGNCRFITMRENLAEMTRPVQRWSQERKDKQSKAFKGHDWNKNNRKPVTYQGVTYPSMMEAQRQTGVTRHFILKSQ